MTLLYCTLKASWVLWLNL